jgi:hypothetical protein
MSLNTNFNVNPYYDDFDEDKKFLRLLFKPGYAVQARELTQLQTLLQNQTSRFGNHIFKNGSIVTGGQTFLQDATYLKLDTDYSGTAVSVTNFDGKTITNTTGTKRGEVVVVYDADAGTGDPKTILIKQLYGPAFSAGDTIQTSETAPVYANISTSGVGTGQLFSANEGVYFYDGFFIKTDPQTVATAKYSNTTANVRIGFEVTESVVVSSQDTSLLDPAQDASNYQAPGSDRYKVELVLATRSLTSTDDTQFIEIARVENGQLVYSVQYPLYAVLEETLARRTFDESGNYTVKPFKIALETSAANTAKANVVLSPGKAYVYGYEFETIGSTTITLDKPRLGDNVSSKRISADYGYYVYANNNYGTFPINSLQTVDLHCVANSLINTATTATISNTKIGTTRIKSVQFDGAANTSNSQTYVYRTYLFDVNIGSITGNVLTSNTTTITIGNVGSGQYYSTQNNAYTGAKIRITAGPGAGETPKFITNYNGATGVITLSAPFSATPNTQSTWSIDFEFNDVDSLATFSSTTKINGADIDISSRDYASTYEDAFISDTNLEPLIFDLGQKYVTAGSISNYYHSYKRLYESQAFVAGLSPALTTGSGEDIAPATSSSEKPEKYQIVVTNAGSSSYTVGQIIPSNLFTVDSGTNKITVTNGGSMTANIIATIDVTSPTAKTKQLVAANSTVQTSGGTSIFANNGVITYTTQGQVHIMANTVVKTPDTVQSLFVPDVIALVQVLDFNGNQITVANSATATDITSRYNLDTGQRDSYYDHASIKLKSGVTTPTGPLVVKYNRHSSSGAGFFTVDSYPTYANIPSYTSATTGNSYELRDSLDYRPVRSIPTTAATANTVTFDVDSTTTGPKILENGSDVILSYQYYLPRIDKVVLNKNKSFEVLSGVPSLTPVEPKDKDGAMTLYILRHPAYLADTANTKVEYTDNRRYTMRDIGTISKRIENLEYYTALSLLEQDAINKQDLTILDSTNLPRFKNGIIVDSFNGSSVADASKEDFEISIDPKNKEIRPKFNVSSHLLTFNTTTSTNYMKSGPLITANGSHTALIDQSKASRSINVNPFNVINYLGKIVLDPPSDIWIDTDKQPDVLVNLEGDKDAWSLITQNAFSYEWGDWETYWTGTSTSEGAAWRRQDWVAGESMRRVMQSITTTTTSNQTRTGIRTQVVPATITESLGDRVIDVSIIPYMRNRNILFTGSDFKPNTTLYPFFDSTAVEKYVARSNKITLAANNLQYRTQSGNPETVNVSNTATSTTNGTALIVRTSNTEAFIVSVDASTSLVGATMNLVGQSTGTTIKINGYDHYSGRVTSATPNTVVLAAHAAGANNIGSLVGEQISIVYGTGVGQQATIESYAAATRNVAITGTWTTTPSTDSIYSIGRLTSTSSGDTAGIFFCPTGVFRVGEKNFRLIDNASGDIPSSSTNGDAAFFAQGILQKTEDTIISTTVPTIQRAATTDSRVVSSTTTREVVIGYWDPLAQTFLISPVNYPQGVFLSKARFCFKSADSSQPITLQVRPASNGYPSSSVIYPYSTVTLTPDKVKTTLSPSLADADSTKWTEFVFDAPIYLQPGEHSFVLLANSNKYEVYVAEIGKLDLVNNRQISEQPYGGSLFLSQNGSTWTADQNSDMMFRLYRYIFSTDPVTAFFTVDYPASNTAYDLTHLITSDVSLANTSVNYSFKSEKSTGGLTPTFLPITPFKDYPMTDGYGRRVLNPATGNSTFNLSATIATTNPDISPILDTSRYGIIAVENIINNLPLSNSDITILNGGTAYSTNANAVVTISGGGGSGATAAAVVTSNVVTSVYLTAAGSGYTTSPTITIVDANTTPGTGVTVVYNGEDKKTGGNGAARYITRRVTLSDGFDSGDLRVYITAYKPSLSNILVYYKLLSTSDPDTFDDKNYQLMTQLSNANFVSANEDDYREIAFAPGINGTANNSVSYTTASTGYNTFRTFAIKIVLTGTSTVDVPKVRDFRAIALPAGA